MTSGELFKPQQGIDADYLNTIYGDDPEIPIEMFEEYLKQTPLDMAAMIASFEKGDAKQVKGHLHKIRPGFTYVGLMEIAEKIKTLELHCAEATDLTVYKEEFQQITNHITSAQVIIESNLQNLYSLRDKQ